MAFLVACLVVTVLLIWWAVGAVREDVHEHVLGLVGCGIVGLVTVPFSIALLLSIVDRSFLTSPCPACGQVDTRGFAGGPTVCGSCFSYLVAEGTTIRESGEEAVEEVPWFRLRAADLADGADWKMPGGCALCAAPAVEQRGVGPFDTERDIVSKETQAAVQSVLQFEGTMRRNLIGQALPGGGGERLVDRHFNTSLHSLRYGLCGQHRQAKHAVVDWTGDLGFRGYRAYREFCRLNGFVRRSAGPRP